MSDLISDLQILKYRRYMSQVLPAQSVTFNTPFRTLSYLILIGIILICAGYGYLGLSYPAVNRVLNTYILISCIILLLPFWRLIVSKKQFNSAIQMLLEKDNISLYYLLALVCSYGIVLYSFNHLYFLQNDYLITILLARVKTDLSQLIKDIIWTFVFYLSWIILAGVLTLFIRICLYFYFSLGIKLPSVLNRLQTRSVPGLWIGEATGYLAKLEHGAGLAPRRQVSLSFSDATRNILILGAIGSGKTTKAIHPLLLQLVEQQCGGLIFDIKGDFAQAVTEFASVAGAGRLRIIGPGQLHLNLLEGLSPEVAASFLKSSMTMSGNNKMDSLWLDTAVELCRNALGILSFFPEHYSLVGLHSYLFDEQQRHAIDDKIQALFNAATNNADTKRLLTSYQNYITNVFENFDEQIKTGVLVNVAQILAPFNHPELIDAFCKSSNLAMEDVLNGVIYLVNLPLMRWGIGGKVACNFIKLRFFNVMQQRSLQADWEQDRYVFFMCDEYQEIASANRDGLSDLNFWDKARSSKTIGIIATQSISSFYAAIGDRDSANAVLQNFRQKICFLTEDQATLDLLNQLTGSIETDNTTMARPVINPQLIRTLKPHQAIALLVIKGHSSDDILNMNPVYI